jgi:predicted acetyltransferase
MSTLPDGLQLRAITEPEIPDFVRAIDLGFGHSTPDSRIEAETRIIECDRSFAVFDGDQIVGTIGAQTLPISLPGGGMGTCSGIAYVTVKPSHRRRGILRAMMTNQLAQSRERGELFTMLWASEALIYGRFGFGVATATQNASIRKPDARFRRDVVNAPGTVRMMSGKEALRHMQRVWSRAMQSWAGMLERREHWWEFTIADPEHERHGATDRYRVVYLNGDVPEGYAVYRVQPDSRELAVEELLWNTDDAHTGLWNYLFGVDLVESISYWNLTPDDPLQWRLADSRRLRRVELDGMWLRLIDVKAALESRTYSADGGLTIRVSDEYCPWNNATYRLTVRTGHGTVDEVDATADLSLDADALGAAYLGGVSFSTLEAAARAVSPSADLLALADAMFRTERLPWCPEEI